jgi:hypothetical protein
VVRLVKIGLRTFREHDNFVFTFLIWNIFQRLATLKMIASVEQSDRENNRNKPHTGKTASLASGQPSGNENFSYKLTYLIWADVNFSE